jgi:uncharacterized protein YkwD
VVIRVIFLILVATVHCSGIPKRSGQSVCRADHNLRDDLLNGINEFRRQNGLPSFTHNERLTLLAADRIVQFFGKSEFYDGQIAPPLRWLESHGYPALSVGENVLKILPTPFEEISTELILRTWTGRTKERLNLLDPDYRQIGFEMKSDSKECYAILFFADGTREE